MQVQCGVLVDRAKHELDDLAQPEAVAKHLPLLFRNELEESVAGRSAEGTIEDGHEALPHLNVRATEANEECLLHAHRKL